MKRRNRKKTTLLSVSLMILFALGILTIGFIQGTEYDTPSNLKGKMQQIISSVLKYSQGSDGNPIPADPHQGQKPTQQPPEPEPVNITIACVGDILIHNTLYYGAYDPSTRTYDFRNQFQYVKPHLQNADITIANLETTLAGPEKGYSSYPKFNTPDSIIDALKDAGVDILTAANNHRMDTGVQGFYRTIRVVRQKGLDVIGVKTEQKEKTYVVKEVKGVKIAFINFGYGYPLSDGSFSINGLILPVDMSGLLDTFDPQDFDSSIRALNTKISAAKDDGAELIVVNMHWGDEYQRKPNEFQQKLASSIVASGAHVIFGGHPHVLQPAVYLPASEESRAPVFYSLGNFISDQRKETVDDIYTEQGMVAKVTFRVQKNKKPQVIHSEAIPTWVNKKIVNSRFFYEVIPVPQALSNKEKFPLLNNADLDRIRFCSDTVSILTAGIKE